MDLFFETPRDQIKTKILSIQEAWAGINQLVQETMADPRATPEQIDNIITNLHLLQDSLNLTGEIIPVLRGIN